MNEFFKNIYPCFKVSGVPALLVYREGQLLANFIRLTDQLGEDFYANEVR